MVEKFTVVGLNVSHSHRDIYRKWYSSQIEI
jgi:hypothetical protein